MTDVVIILPVEPRTPPDLAEFGIDADALKQLHKVRPGRATLQLLFVAALFAGAGVFGTMANHPVAWLGQWVVQGLVMAGMLCAAHFCIHSTLWGRPWDRYAGAVLCAPLLVNFSVFQNFHLEHHRHTGADDDPQPPRVFSSVWRYLRRMFELRFIAKFGRWSINSLRGEFPYFVRSAKARKAVQQDAVLQLVWVLAMIALTVAFPHLMITNYWIPWLFFIPSIFLVTVGEHYGCEKGDNVYRNTRTIGASRLLRLVLWDINFHGEHHIFPRMPGSSLAKLPPAIGLRFAYRQPSYLAFHVWAVRGLLARSGSKDRA